MKRKHIPIFLAADDNYLPYLTVTLKSISEHSSPEYVYDVRVLNTGLQPYNVRRMRRLRFDNINLFLVDVTDSVEAIRSQLSVRLRDYYSEAIFYRIFISAMYPRINKAIYIDCDTVLVDDIAKLYFTEMGENILAGVTDECVQGVPEFCDYVEHYVGVKPEKYINSGVLVINFKQFRKHRVAEKFIELLVEHNPDTVAPDQDYLNFLCRDKIHYLDAAWNKQPNPANPAPIAEQHLIHYNMHAKPWHRIDVLYSEEFWDVARRTPYYEDIRDEYLSYNDEKKAKDEESGAVLLSHALSLANSGGGFVTLLTSEK